MHGNRTLTLDRRRVLLRGPLDDLGIFGHFGAAFLSVVPASASKRSLSACRDALRSLVQSVDGERRLSDVV